MRALTKRIDLSSPGSALNIYFLGDCHLGNALCDEEKLDADIDEIKRSRGALVVLMGDLIDAIHPRDKRFELGLIADWVDRDDIIGSQITYCFNKFSAVGEKIIGLVEGNHENTINREFSLHVGRSLLERAQGRGWEWEDLSYSALIRLIFRYRARGKYMTYTPLDIFVHHGYGGGRTMSEINQFRDWQSDYRANWYIAGHTHRRYVVETVWYGVEHGGNLTEERKLIGRSGTYLKTIAPHPHAGYAERAGMRPLVRGCLRIKYYPREGRWVL